MTITKFLTLLPLFVVFVVVVGNHQKVRAGCLTPAICDATPGSCSNSCNGGQTCVVGEWVQNGCAVTYTGQCSSNENISCTGVGTNCDLEYKCSDGSGPCSVNGASCGIGGPYGGGTCDPYTAGTCVGPFSTGAKQCDPNGYVCYGESVIPRCCNGLPGCGDGICNANGGETKGNCPADCGSVAGAVCGNGACETGETAATCPKDCSTAETCGNGSCNGAAGENCNNCAADCGACTGCGDGSCNAGETCSSCPGDCGSCSNATSCGDGSCNGNENCGSCPTDCGSCNNPFCGDGACTGSETCSSCATDCGECNPAANGWWQVLNGDVFSAQTSGTAIQSKIPYETCSGSCTPYLMIKDTAGNSGSAGIAITGGGSIDSRDHLTQGGTPIQSIGTANNRVNENYDYFSRRYSLGSSTTDDFTVANGNDPSNATKPTFDANKKYYFHSGDMTISQLWNVGATESYVVFVDGNLTFTDPNSIRRLTQVNPGGFLAFIVSGNITVNSNVYRNTITNASSNLEGVFIADGQIIVQTNGGAGTDKRFNGEGVFVGWSGITLQRDLGTSNNGTHPGETFTYRPDFVQHTPQEMKRSQLIWQEKS